MIWIVPTLVILGAIIWLVNGIRQIGAVSSGTPIKARSETALLMIDLQTVFWDASIYREAAKTNAKAQILAAVDRAKSNGDHVIALRQEWSIPSTKFIAKLLMKGQAIAGTSGTELAAPFDGIADHILVKRVQDGFETKELDTLLRKLNVGKLHIVGLDANYCVAKTALAARQRGYCVEIIKRGVMAADPKAAEKTFAILHSQGVTSR